MVTCMKKLINKKTGLKGIFILIILLCLVAVVLINVIATVLDSRYNLSIDLTKNHLFELDKATIEYISSLEKPVHIQMLAKEETFVEVSTYNAQANEILRQFEKNSKAITLSYVDYIKDPTFPSKYPDLKMKHGDILVSSGEAHRLIETESLFNYTTTATGQIAIASSKAEETICAAILNVTSDETIKVSVLTGHAEYTMPSFVKLLENNNYELVLQNLITEDINPEAKFALLITPKTDLNELELECLENFLYNNGEYGKTLLYFAGPEQGELSNLDVFLKEWGVAIGDGAVFETDANRVYNYHPFYPVVDYIDIIFANMVQSKNMPMLVPLSRPLKVLFEYRGNNSTSVLLEFAKSTGVRPSDAPENFVAEDATWVGPIPAMVMASKKIPDKSTGKTRFQSNIIVSGTAGVIDSYIIDNPALMNAEYLLNIFNTLSERENVIKVKSKSITGNSLNITRQQANTLGIVFIVVIPMLILGAGAVVWLSRRYE